jgi:phosphoribosylanthranilate isomerase
MCIPRVKICCIMSIEEARQAVAAGASALGLVAKMPSGPGVIEDALIATFLLTSETDGDAIIDHVRRCGTSTVQLVDAVEDRTYAAIRTAVPHVKIVQVLHVADEDMIAEARDLAPRVDAYLLDSGNPRLEIKELGGTGRVHDWDLSRRVVDAVDKPVFLAGGLKPENVAEAVQRVRPFGLDLCSGVRTDGRLDTGKLVAFFAAVREAG